MKNKFIALFMTTGITLTFLSSPNLAQSGCTFIGQDGKPVDLGNLCGQESQPNTVTIPIKRRSGGIPVIDVTFNNQETFEMLFDTGASVVLVTDQMADVLQLRPTGQQAFKTAGGVVVNLMSIADSVQAGSLVVKRIPVSISSHTSIGLLGQQFFEGYDVVIRRDVIELYKR